MAEAIYVRFEGRYWRLSVLLKRYGISATAGYKRHVAYGRPKIYKLWMLAPMNSTVAIPVAVTIDGVPYRSIKEASADLGVPKNRISRRIKKFGASLSLEQVKTDDPRGGVANFKRKPVKSEWEMLSNKRNTGAARRPTQPMESHTHY